MRKISATMRHAPRHAFLGGMLLVLAGCAGGPSSAITGEALDAVQAPTETTAEAPPAPPVVNRPVSSLTASSGAEIPFSQLRGKPKDTPYPSFGAPTQIGDKPVMTPEERAKMQENLENLADKREGQFLREIEAEQ